MVKQLRWWISAGVNVLMSVLITVIAHHVPQIYPLFYTDFSRKANRFLASVTAFLPVPVWQLALVGLAAWQLVLLIRSLILHRFGAWIARFAVLVSTLAFLFVALWGLNFFGPDVSDAVDMRVGEYTKTELTQALRYYADEASRLSAQVERDAEGGLVMPDFDTLSDGAVASYARLAETYPRFSDPAPRVKRLLVSELYGKMGITGVYVCLTGEPGVSAAEYGANVPFTMCHELGHSLCFCGEDEANFCGFLACSYSEDPLFRYSGYLNAFVYCYNALWEIDRSAAVRIWQGCAEPMMQDLTGASAHYEKYEGTVQQAAQSVNDAYLHVFEQEGVQSYNMVTDHLIAYYLKYAAG